MSARQRTEKKEARRASIGTWAKMLLYLVLGGVAGGTASVGIIRLQESGGMDGLGQLYSGMLQWAPAAQAAVFLVLFLWSLVYFRRATKEMEAPYSDEEDERADQSQGMAMLLCSTNMIVSFLLFGLAADPESKQMMLSILLFALSAVACCVEQALLVYQIKRRNEMMKGDPMSLKFAKDWEGSMDEAQKTISYRSAYKAYRVLQTGLLVCCVLSIMGRLLLGTGLLPVVISCGLWLLGNSVYSKSAMENQMR